MRRGEVLLVDLEPVKPGEASKRRPCIVVSNNGSNAAVERHARGTITIVPLTSNVSTVRDSFQVLVDDPSALTSMGLSRVSKAQAEQVRTVSFERVGETLGWTPPAVTGAIDVALRFHLSL